MTHPGGRTHDADDVHCACDGCDRTGEAAVIAGHQPKKCGLWALGHQPPGQVEGLRGAPWDKRKMSWVTPKSKKPSKKSKKPEYHFEFPNGAGPMCFEHLNKVLRPKGASAGAEIPKPQLDYARRAYIKKYCMKGEPTEVQKREGYFSKDNLPQTVFDCPDGQGGWVHPSHENYQHGPVLSVKEMETMKFDDGKLMYGKKTTWDKKRPEGEPWPFKLEKWQTPPFDKDTAIGMHMCLSDPEYDARDYEVPMVADPSANQQTQLLELHQKLRAETARRKDAEKALKKAEGKAKKRRSTQYRPYIPGDQESAGELDSGEAVQAAAAGTQPAGAATALTAAAPPPATVAMIPPQQQRHDIADVIETCVAAPTEQSVAMASIALYRHKRAHGDDPGMSILLDALEGAKRMCREKGIL